MREFSGKLGRLTTVGLGLLLLVPPALGFYHLHVVFEGYEEGAHHLLRLSGPETLGSPLAGLAREISQAIQPGEGGSDSVDREGPIASVRFVHASSLPAALPDDPHGPCAPFRATDKGARSVGCGHFVLPLDSPYTLDEVGEYLNHLALAPILERTYKKLRAIEEAAKLNDVLTLYAVLPFRDSKVALGYPGLHLGRGYDFTARAWYQKSSALRIGEVSPLYADYVSHAVGLTLVNRSETVAGEVRAAMDVTMPAPSHAFVVFLLNLFVTFVGLTGCYLSYRHLKRRFLGYLTLGVGLVFLAYLLLVANTLLGLASGISLEEDYLLTRVVPLVPSGTPLLLAGLCYRRGRNLDIVPYLVAFLAIEVLSGLAAFAEFSRVPNVLFSGVALCFLGVSIAQTQLEMTGTGRFRRQVLGVSRKLAGTAFFVWGVGQLVLLLGPDWWLFLTEGISLPYRESVRRILVSEVGGLWVLAYLKAVAFLFLFVLLMKQAYHRELRLAQGHRGLSSVFELDEDGRLVGTPNVPAQLPKGTSVGELTADPEDRAEIDEAFRSGFALSSYVCQVPALYGGDWVHLDMVRDRDDGPLHWVEIRRLTASALSRWLEVELCQEVASFLKTLQSRHATDFERVVAPEVERLSARVGREGSLASRRRLVSENKAVLRDVVDAFADGLRSLSGRDEHSDDLMKSVLSSKWPGRVRLNIEAWRMIVAGVTTAIQEVAGDDARSGGWVLLPTSYRRLYESEFLTMFLSVRGSTEVAQLARGASKRATGVLPEELGSLTEVRLQAARSMLQFFGGELLFTGLVDKGHSEIEFRIPFLCSS